MKNQVLDYLQQPLWEVQFSASSLWSGLLTGHLLEEDGPVPWGVPWMYWNHQWHHHAWSHWGRTWCPSAKPHAGCSQVWSCVQPTENACKGPSCKYLWLPIWCQWCTPRSREGWCCACSPSTHKCHQTPRVPQHGDTPQPLHPRPVHPDCPSVRTPEKRCQLHLECQLCNCFWVSQASCHQQHHTQILRPITACDHTSWCFPGRPRHSTLTEQQTHSFCKQSTHWCRMQICKHRERDASSCLQSRVILHLHLWMVLHDWIRPQAAWIHLQEEPSRHACMAPMHDATPAGIWPNHPLLPRQGNGHTRHTLSIQSLARPRLPIGYHYPPCLHNANPQGSLLASLCQWCQNESSCWPHHHCLARGHQGGPPSPPSILATQRDPHHWGWSSPVRWSTHHSSCQKGESPASTASIPSRNTKVTVAHMWKFLLAQH